MAAPLCQDYTIQGGTVVLDWNGSTRSNCAELESTNEQELFLMALLRDLNVKRMICYEFRSRGAQMRIDMLSQVMRRLVKDSDLKFYVSKLELI
jgi:hypothetical protein